MLTGRTARSYGATPEAAALAFVSENRMLLGLIDERHSVRIIRSTLMRKHWRVTLQQEFDGIDVYDGTIHVVIDEQGHVLHVTNSMWPASEVDFSSDVGDGAVRTLVAHRFAGQDITYSEEPRRVIYPSGTGQLAYLAYVFVGPRQESWRALVDARTGGVLELTRLTVEDQTSGRDSATHRDPARPLKTPFDVNDPCDREWIQNGATVTPVPNPADPYYVDVSMGTPDLGEFDMQMPGIYAAGIKLLPCIDYTIEVSYSVKTWGAYNTPGNFIDVFFVDIDTSGWYWDFGFMPSAELFCATDYDEMGAILPGKAWAAGGEQCGDHALCSLDGSFNIQYMEPDNTKEVYLSIGMERVSYACPCWGTIRVKIIAQSRVFNPNPVATMNAMFADEDDANFAVPCAAYSAVDLAELTTPPAGQPWRLTGSYCAITEKNPPAKVYMSSRDGDFPYLRRCDTFEAVNAYHHITQNQLYIQALGFFTVNSRAIPVDPHVDFNGEDNSWYQHIPPGAGYIEFGDFRVDDAEDGDVILHEYGHAIQDNQTPLTYLADPGGNNGFGNETRAMGEGFGDYWACSDFADESLASGFDPAAAGEWDWLSMTGLRRVDKNKVYPDSMAGEEHVDGEIWSRTLWDLYLAVGKATADILVLESHFLIGVKPKFSDGAKVLLAADVGENAGANENTIVNIYVDRGIFRELSVTSIPAGVPISVSLEDVRGDQDGVAAFDRVYAWGDTVNLTAPASFGVLAFSHWTVDGVDGASGVLGTLVVMDHTPASHTAIANYSTLPGGPVCSVNPTSIDFGFVPLGSTRDEIFTIVNVGNGGLVAGTVSETCGEYSIVAGEGNFSLAPGESCQVTVRLAPTSPGTKNCTVETGTASCSDVACTGIVVWSADPTGNTPVCTADSEQYGPRIIPDGANGVIMAWNDSRFPDWGIYAQRLGGDGVAMWANDGVPVVPLVQSDALVIVSDEAGGVIAAWVNSAGDVYVQRLDAGGVRRWGAGGVLLCTAPGAQSAPLGIVPDGGHGAIVTWKDWRNVAAPAMYARRVNSAGVPQWDAGGVYLGIGAGQEGCTVRDGAGGAIAVGYGMAPNLGIAAQRVNSSGTLLWGPSGAQVVAPGGALGPESVVADGSGGAIVAFGNGVWPNQDIFAQRLDPVGNRIWTPASGVPLCTEGSPQDYPNLCLDGSGGAIVSWADYRMPANGPDIYARRVRGDGTPAWASDGVPIAFQTRAGDFRDIVSDDEGGAIIGWMDFRNSVTTSQDIWAQRVDSSGQIQWVSGGRAVCVAPGNQITPRMARLCSCGVVLVWEDFRNAGNPDIYAQQVGCSGDLGEWDTGGDCLAVGGIGNKPIQPRNEPATVSRGSDVPSVPGLYWSVPNPFNPSTRIRYDVPSPGGAVAIVIYDVSGRLVRTLVKGEATPGEKSVTWDGRNDRGEDVSSGVYFYRMTLGSFSQTRKMVLLR